MWHRIFFLSLLVGAASAVDSAIAQFGDYGLIPETTVRQNGLERAWRVRLEASGPGSEIRHTALHVSATDTHSIFEVTHDDGQISISARDLNRLGQPQGRAEAERRAEFEKGRLEALGYTNVNVEERVVPRVTLYVAAGRGLLQAIDGETGRVRWTRSLGNTLHPTLEPAANDQYVAVIHGITLQLLSAEDGGLIWSKKLSQAPGAGPALSRSYIHVPMIGGLVRSFPIARDEPSHVYQSSGRIMVQAVAAAGTLAWPTSHDMLYVCDAEGAGVRYRLETNGEIAAPPAFGPDGKLYVASADGYIHCVEVGAGDVIWRFSSGERMSRAPVVIDDAVYCVSDDGGMYCLDREVGVRRWWTPDVQKFLAASEQRVYALDRSGRLQILDRETGGRIGEMPIHTLDFAMTNTATDRLYLGMRNGLIQCLHERQLEFPVIHQVMEPKEPEARQTVQEGIEEPAEPARAPAEPAEPADDPFGGAGDPFGGGAPAEDPFGGGAAAPEPAEDPVGAADDGDADPFGGGADDDEDPFGAGADEGADPFAP